MISCQTFRAALVPGTDDANVLEHLRTCDACLDYAVGIDPDLFFRAIGGNEMVPPGGVDAFVGDVMAQVRSRQTESVTHRLPLNRYLRAAAAVLLVIAGTTGVYRYNSYVTPQAPQVIARMAPSPILKPTATKAVVESYQSQNATIVEVPGTSDATVVMIYDESLPADL